MSTYGYWLEVVLDGTENAAVDARSSKTSLSNNWLITLAGKYFNMDCTTSLRATEKYTEST